MKVESTKEAYTQLGTLQEFEILETPILAGIVHMRESIALKRVCENLGLNWTGQYQRLQRNKELSQLCVQAKHKASDGKNYEMICLPPLAFQQWLMTLSDSESENLKRDLLNEYQQELVIRLMMMLKMSLDEIERMRAVESRFASLSNTVKYYMAENEKAKSLKEQAAAATKTSKELQEKIITDIETGLNQLSINY